MTMHKVIVKTYTGNIPDLDCWHTLKADKRYHHFNVWADANQRRGTQPTTGEHFYDPFKNMFETQLVTAAGVRIHDWADYMNPHDLRSNGKLPAFRFGHYVVNIDELQEVRAGIYRCRYCGKLYPSDIGWCQSCISSQYLTSKGLPLLRVASLFGADLKALPQSIDDVPADIISNYERHHIDGFNSRIHNWYTASVNDAEARIIDAKILLGFQIFCAGRKVPLDTVEHNLIYYRHTNTLCFGWSDRLTTDEAAAISNAVGTDFKGIAITYGKGINK